MKILVVGGGGREHALAWKLAQSPHATEVLVAPGNAGTAGEPKCRNVAVAADDVDKLLELAQAKQIDLTVVGPEAPLAAGIVDAFRTAGLRIFGPTRAAAQLEASKSFTKELLTRHDIPTAAYQSFSELRPALGYVAERGAPIVVKADGLAAGKGVMVAETVEQAQQAIRGMFSGSFGQAGARVVVEDFLQGEEASYMVVANGTCYVPLASSQDHKRVGDGDTGPNTGGMGACSPTSVVTAAVEARVRTKIVEPTLAAMAAAGCPFTGFLYAGLMIDAAGQPSVIEFNARLGDPETQPLMMRLDSDLLELLQATIDGDPRTAMPRWKPQAALGVVMASGGYPGKYEKGQRINGLEAVPADRTKVFHAGTRQADDGAIVTAGGRVLCVCALGDSIAAAGQTAYEAAAGISFPGVHYRHDIGARAGATKSQEPARP